MLQWKSSTAPTLTLCKLLVNSTFPLSTNQPNARGSPKKFHKVWDIWAASDMTAI